MLPLVRENRAHALQANPISPSEVVLLERQPSIQNLNKVQDSFSCRGRHCPRTESQTGVLPEKSGFARPAVPVDARITLLLGGCLIVHGTIIGTCLTLGSWPAVLTSSGFAAVTLRALVRMHSAGPETTDNIAGSAV